MISRHILLVAASALLVAGAAICVADGISNSNSAHPMGNIALGFDAGISLKTNTPTRYVGPGDIVSGAVAFYSLRAYSRAWALPGTHVAIRAARFADGTHPCDILITPTGGLGNTVNCSTGGDNGLSPLSFLGVRGTCLGTTSGTTLTCTGATATPDGANFDMVSGAGIAGLYLNACGAFVGGAGSCTMNAPAAVDITTPETITFVKLSVVSKWYDQSGHGFDAPAAVSLSFNPTGLNGVLPIVIVGGGSFSAAIISSSSLTYYTSVAARQIGLTTQYAIMGNYDDTTNANGSVFLFSPVANRTQLNVAGGGIVATTSDLVLHSLQAMANGASSVINVDGTESSGTLASPVAGTQLCVGVIGHAGGCGTEVLQGSYSEMGTWVATPSNGIRKQMCKNMANYWKTTNSC